MNPIAKLPRLPILDRRTVYLRTARREVKRLLRRNDKARLLLILCVYIPTGLLGLYLFCFFSNMYISESRLAIRSGDGLDLGSASVLGSLFQSPISSLGDAFIIQEYIGTFDMLEKVEESLHWQAHFSDRRKDIYSRLPLNPTREELLEYWQWLVTVTYDLDKGILIVQVKAYTPEMARDINRAILQFSEDLVNQMNDRAHQDAIKLAREEVDMAGQRLLQAQAALRKFRDEKSLLDPKAVASGLEGVIAKLEGEAAATEAELAAALRVMREQSPAVANIRRKLQSLKDQLVVERTRLAGLAPQGGSLSGLVGDYAQLAAEEEFSQKLRMEAMSALEKARIRAEAQSRYIVPFQSPTLPQESEYPRALLFTVAGFFLLLLGLGICSLIVAAIKDHMGV